jgi:hypothetical protein
MPADRPPDVAVRRIAVAGALIAGTVALVVAAIVFELRLWGVPLDGRRALEKDRAAQGAALESAPQPDLRRFLAEKARELEAIGIVDRRAGIARIPIESAMELMTQRGLRAAPGEDGS